MQRKIEALQEQLSELTEDSTLAEQVEVSSIWMSSWWLHFQLLTIKVSSEYSSSSSRSFISVRSPSTPDPMPPFIFRSYLCPFRRRKGQRQFCCSFSFIRSNRRTNTRSGSLSRGHSERWLPDLWCNKSPTRPVIRDTVGESKEKTKRNTGFVARDSTRPSYCKCSYTATRRD